MKTTIKQALQTLNYHFGASIFSSPKQFKAALADVPIESDAKKIRNLLNIAICEMKAYSRLESALSNKNNFAVDNLSAELSSDFSIEKPVAQMIIECVAELLGYVPDTNIRREEYKKLVQVLKKHHIEQERIEQKQIEQEEELRRRREDQQRLAEEKRKREEQRKNDEQQQQDLKNMPVRPNFHQRKSYKQWQENIDVLNATWKNIQNGGFFAKDITEFDIQREKQQRLAKEQRKREEELERQKLEKQRKAKETVQKIGKTGAVISIGLYAMMFIIGFFVCPDTRFTGSHLGDLAIMIAIFLIPFGVIIDAKSSTATRVIFLVGAICLCLYFIFNPPFTCHSAEVPFAIAAIICNGVACIMAAIFPFKY